jgi:gamma-glutamyltranspeptidase/glutathione hydrolase
VNVAGIAPCMIYLADTREVMTIAGVGSWPRAASCAALERKHQGRIPRGLLRTVVPAAPAAWVAALQRYGTMSFGEVADAAIRFARDGFASILQRGANRRNADDYRSGRKTPRLLPGGGPPEPGGLFVQTDLAKSLNIWSMKSALRGRGREAGCAPCTTLFIAAI